MPSYIEICNFNEEYDKKYGGGQNCPLMVGPISPPVSRDGLGHRWQKKFPSAQINFMKSRKKTRRNILRFSGYLAKTARGGKIAPPHLE